MEDFMLEAALSQGIWAVVAVALLIYIVKSNEKRDLRQEKREENYQKLLSDLTEKFSVLTSIQNDIEDIKSYISQTPPS